MEPLGLFTCLPYGKYLGIPLYIILNKDFLYLRWLLENTEIELTEEALLAYYFEEEKQLRGFF